MKKPPSLRNNNGSLQVRVRIDGKDAFINRLGRWDDPVAVATAHAIAAQIWSDYQQGTFDRSLMAYQPLINGKEVGVLEALRVRAETKRQAAAIHAYRVLQRYGKPIRTRSDAEGFLAWLRAEGLSDCTIAGLMTHYRQCSGGNRHLFSHKLKWQRRSVQSDVLSVEDIQVVLADLESNEPWYYPLFLLWLSTGMRNAEIRGLTWDCIRWEDGEVLVCKSLRRDGYSSGHHSWASTKTGKERVVPLTAQVREVLRQHKEQMEQLAIYDPYGLVFVAPTSYSNIYDHLVGRVWKRSLERCGLKPRRLYAQRHSFLSHALAMGNSPADLAAAAGHSTKMLLDTYAKPTGRLKMPSWQTP
ncbi:site-specific integrase [Synechococcus sp. BS56D]|uniref:site-specific integrase n=1 Tax=Synechococcus sp. BS56D TaxID=2055944 RepID=UPI001F103B6A|nr:site-specific integrase [Synechococcus sp. BS56D]